MIVNCNPNLCQRKNLDLTVCACGILQAWLYLIDIKQTFDTVNTIIKLLSFNFETLSILMKPNKCMVSKRIEVEGQHPNCVPFLGT